MVLKVTPNQYVSIVEPLFASGEQMPTNMLWGPPGVGKSEVVGKTLVNRLRELTGKEVNFFDIRLLLFNPVDLRGIPVPDADREFAKWLRPTIFNLDPSPEVINIILLDEITAASPTVQASAYQLTLDRKVGEHRLPDNTIIIAAGNRVQDKGVVYKMPTPLANRMTHFEIYASLEDWKEWAIPHGINELVIGFLNFRENLLHKFDPNADDVAFPTPRAWAFVSKYLGIYRNVDKAYPMIAGTVGEGTAVEFRSFVKTFGKLPNIDNILDGKEVEVPDKPDVLYALSAALTARAGKIDGKRLRNLIVFTNRLPKEFSVLTMRDILRVPDVKNKVTGLKEWIDWANAHKAFIF